MAEKSMDLTGCRFGKLKVIKRIGTDNSRHSIYECICDCGKITTASTKSLKSGDKKSCGCIRGKNTYFPGIAPGLFALRGGGNMALYAQIPKSPEKIKQGIIALEWQLKQEIPEKDREIFRQTLEVYKATLNGSQDTQKEIII